MTVTSTDIVNEAIQLIGDNQPLVTGTAPNFDSSPAGVAAAQLYTPTVQAVGRQFGWDFARNTVALTLSGNTAPNGWAFEYLYPSNGIEIWQVQPQTLSDYNDPLPYNWVIGNTLITSVQTKVIWTSIATAYAAYNNQPTEAIWNALFRESFVRLLASELAMGLAGRPETEASEAQASMMADSIARTRSG